MPKSGPHDLKRFADAQAPVFETVVEELKAGRKLSHWMWFVFPQLRGLRHSSMTEFYSIDSLDEARAYLANPILGPRLRLCTKTVLAICDRSLSEIFGSPDDLKFRSSMTLFTIAAPADDRLFRQALDRYCDREMDTRTLHLLGWKDEPAA